MTNLFATWLFFIYETILKYSIIFTAYLPFLFSYHHLRNSHNLKNYVFSKLWSQAFSGCKQLGFLNTLKTKYIVPKAFSITQRAFFCIIRYIRSFVLLLENWNELVILIINDKTLSLMKTIEISCRFLCLEFIVYILKARIFKSVLKSALASDIKNITMIMNIIIRYNNDVKILFK